MKFIVLRSKRQIPKGTSTVPISHVPAAPEDLKIEVSDLTRNDLVDIRRDRQVVEYAPPMAMRLIRPLEATTKGSDAAPEASWGLPAVGVPECPFTGAGIVVAVLDTGIDCGHEAFSGVKLITRNFTGEVDEDIDGHGTHCAGTIFGRPVGGLAIGVAPGVGTALIGKILGKNGGSSEGVSQAMLWAFQEGARVISMSLGIDFPGYQGTLVGEGYPTELATSLALEGYRLNMRLFDRLSNLISPRDSFAQGAILVGAAGNESRLDQDARYRMTVSPPAAAEGFVSVAAIQETGDASRPYRVAPFSNSGATVAAPGVDIWSARRGGGLACLSGTSMAAPHVTGVAALWAQKLVEENKRFKAAEVIAMVIGNAKLKTTGLDAGDVGVGLVQTPS
jgi:subtilisin family serine protease